MKKHPMQPIVVDYGTYRFQKNAIVAHLLDHGGFDMNKLATMEFPRKDREQFAQLIGYSVSGFGDLPYASKKTVAKADEIVARKIDAAAKKALTPQ